MSLLVVGSIALDDVTTPYGSVKEVLGGSAVYFSLSASLFTRVNLVGVVGHDFPKRHNKLLEKRGIDLRGLEQKDGETFRWSGNYVGDMNTAHTNWVKLNVFERFTPSIPRAYKSSNYLFLANIDPDIQMDLLRQAKGTRFLACDSMNHWIDSKKKSLIKLISKVDLFFANEKEAQSLTGETNLKKAARAISSFGPRMVVIKKGEHGAFLFADNKIFTSPAYLLDTVVDPTGAGDSFAGGFMGYMATPGRRKTLQTLRKAVAYGTIMASFCVEGFSVAGLTRIKKRDIAKRFRNFSKMTRF